MNGLTWTEVADEGERLLDSMSGYQRPELVALSMVSAQAAKGAFAAVAAAFGLEPEPFELTVALWYDKQDTPPAPVSFKQFLALYEESRKWLNDIAEGEERPLISSPMPCSASTARRKFARRCNTAAIESTRRQAR